jgi:hypothetical protein
MISFLQSRGEYKSTQVKQQQQKIKERIAAGR